MATVEPRIWRLKEFKSASSPRNPTKRGRDVYLQVVDQCLKKFDEYRNTQLLNDKKFYAYQIVSACRTWLTGKGNKHTGTADMRRMAVSTLGKQCWEWIQYWEFAKKKAVTPGGHANLRTMGTGYAAERTLYVNSGKTENPISGSYMHEALADPGAAALTGGKTFSQLTGADYVTLDNHFQGTVMLTDPFDPAAMAATQVKRCVIFLNKQERVKRLLMINHGLLYDGFNSKFDTFAERAYVIDEYGNLYSTNEVFNNALNFNHSTFNAGKDVICAGIVRAANGFLRQINNNSGHYRPSRQDLHNAVVLLNDEGLDFSQTVITVTEPDPARAGKLIEHDYNNAAAFIANMNALPTQSVPQP